MSFVKSALAILKQLGIQIPPATLAVITVGVTLVVAAVGLLLVRRAKAAKAAKTAGGADDAPTLITPAPAPPVDRLLRSWRGFLGGLPAAYRRSILRFQPFVVLGASGSGKSALIDTFTDWRRQSSQFLRSAVDDPNLQVYLASRALVFEVPATLLHDTSANARETLLQLFKRLFRHRRPVVVVPVDVAALVRTQPDEVRQLADTIRGKINVLSQVHGAPVDVRIVLTHADELRGFAQFARFAERQRIGTTLTLDKELHRDDVHGALLERFARFERLAPLALTTLEADDYLEVAAFLRDAPRSLPMVGTFIGALGARDTLTHTPRLEQIYLTSAAEGVETSNPFLIPTEPDQKLPNPLTRHRWAAAGLTAAAASLFAVGYAREAAQWEPARIAALKYPDRLPPEQDALRRKLRQFQARHETDPLARWFPSFFTHVDRQLDDLITDVTRRRTLLPELERALGSEWAGRKSIYFLALLYATRDNPLGALVRSNADHWAEATGLDVELIEDYVATARVPHEDMAPLERLPTVMVANATNDPQRWSLYFRRVARAIAQGPIAPADLASLQTETEELQLALAAIARFESAATALKTVDEVTGMGIARRYEPLMKEVRAPEMFGSTRPVVERFLDLVRSGSLSVPASEVTLLVELGAQLSVLVEEDTTPDGDAFAITLGDESFVFRAAAWRAAIRTSTARELVLGFVRRNTASGASIFFREDTRGEPVLMNARNNGSYLFTGKGSLRPRTTRAAFDREVRPVVTEFNDLRPKLGLAAEDLEVLDEFVTQAIEEYATEYAEAMDAYYRAYGVQADSADSLQILIKQMLKPGSPFSELLRVVHTNTHLELDDARVPFFKPMNEALAHYGPLHRALAEQEGGYSELEKYKAILEQLLLNLRPDGDGAAAVAGAQGGAAAPPPGAPSSNAGPAAPGAPGAGAPGVVAAVGAAGGPTPSGGAPSTEVFADLLSPTGRLGLSILRGDPGSYRALVGDWVTSMGLSAELARPFRAPVEELERLGAREIGAVLADVWQHKLVVELIPMTHTFPFDRAARADAMPAQIQAIFHPQTGRFVDLRRRYIEDVLAVASDRSRGASIRVPPGMEDVLRRVARLSQMLWDADGKVTPLRLRLSSVPFSASDSKKGLLTLAYLSTGTSSMFNFNQQPFVTTLDVDWTGPQRAQLGVELMNPISGEKTYPTAIVAEDSPWSLLRLIARGDARGEEVAWTFQAGRGPDETAVARFKVHDDPWDLFTLPTSPERRRAMLGAPGTGSGAPTVVVAR